MKILWDFSLESDHHHLSNHPDIVVFDYSKQLIQFIEVSCPVNVPSKEQEKLHKYCPLALDFRLMYKSLSRLCQWCWDAQVLYLLIVSLIYVSSQDFLKATLIGSVHTLRTLNLTG